MLGGLPIPPVELVLDRDAGRRSIDPESDGVIGLDVLSHLRLGLDLRARTLRFWTVDVASEAVLASWYGGDRSNVAALSLWSITTGLFGTTLTLNGEQIGATLDTGSPVTIVKEEFEGKAFKGLRRTGGYRARFYDGTARVDEFATDGLVGLGDLMLPGVSRVGRARLPGGLGSVVGCDVLQEARLLIDFPSRRLYARAVPTSSKAGAPGIKMGRCGPFVKDLPRPSLDPINLPPPSAPAAEGGTG